MIQAQTLAALDGVQHRFFTRQGGVSTGLFSSLNCGYGSGDPPDNVRENRRRVAEQFGLGEPDLQTVHQIHSTDVLTVADDRWTLARRAQGRRSGDRPAGRRAGRAGGRLRPGPAGRRRGLGDRRRACRLEGRAGRRRRHHDRRHGEARRPARAHQVVVGPCIGPASYEVGPEFPAPFLAQDEANAAFFRTATRAGHFMFDLPGYLVHRIARNGVAVTATGHDTLSGTDDFFSYRRNTLQGVRDYGRGLSAIALAA